MLNLTKIDIYQTSDKIKLVYLSLGYKKSLTLIFFIVAPMVRVENQLELAYVSQKNISLHCTSESYPPAIHYWKFSNGSAISGGNHIGLISYYAE